MREVFDVGQLLSAVPDIAYVHSHGFCLRSDVAPTAAFFFLSIMTAPITAMEHQYNDELS
jgi:hypothetical protein